MKRFGVFILVVGVILAIVGGIWFADNRGITLVLLISGLILGVVSLYANSSETVVFLVATIALMMVGLIGSLPVAGGIGFDNAGINNIAHNFALFAAPAAVVGVLRALFGVKFPEQGR